LFAVWLTPNDEDTDYLSSIIKNLSEKYDAPEFFPHITLYGLVDVALSIVEDAVRYSIENLSPFLVKNSSISYSDNFWKSIFINIELNHQLKVINSRLAQRLSKYSVYEFIPHISLIYKIIDTSKKIKIINKLKLKPELTINKIGIQKFSENIHDWKIVRYFEL